MADIETEVKGSQSKEDFRAGRGPEEMGNLAMSVALSSFITQMINDGGIESDEEAVLFVLGMISSLYGFADQFIGDGGLEEIEAIVAAREAEQAG